MSQLAPNKQRLDLTEMVLVQIGMRHIFVSRKVLYILDVIVSKFYVCDPLLALCRIFWEVQKLFHLVFGESDLSENQ